MDKNIWKRCYEIVVDYCRHESEILPTEFLAESLENSLHPDKKVSIVEIKGIVPYCFYWPDYTGHMIHDFNTRLNRYAPNVYNPSSRILGPVNWKSFSGSIYDKEFNIPLNIGYSLGMGVFDPVHEKEIVYCLHKSRSSTGFSEEDLQLMVLLQPLIGSIFSLENRYLFKEFNQYLPRESAPGCRKLSKREREIVQYLLSRESMTEIAASLGLSKRTVETHALHIYQKLCVSSRESLKRFLMH